MKRAARFVGVALAVLVAGLVPLELARAGTRPEPSVTLPTIGAGGSTGGTGGNFVQSITVDTKGRVTAATAATPGGGGGWQTAYDVNFAAMPSTGGNFGATAVIDG